MRNVFLTLLALVTFTAAVAETVSYEGDLKAIPLSRTGKNLRGDSELPEVVLNTFVYQVRETEKELNKLVYDCESYENDGTGGNWHNFWSTPKDFKALHLKEAIKGLDFYTANRLVKDGVFDTKPRSWADFERRIEEASLRYGNYFSWHVLVEYKEENMRNLGYLRENCGHRWVRTVQKIRERISSEPRTLRAQVRVHGAPLLPSERETFTVTFDGFRGNLSWVSDHNNYSMVESRTSDGVVVWDLQGTRRVEAPANTLELRLTNMSGNLGMLVSDSNFDRDTAAIGSRKIVAAVYQVRKVWDPRSDILVGNFERNLDNNQRDTALNDLGIALPPGKIRVRYAIRYENNPYYSTQPSSDKTAEIKN